MKKLNLILCLLISTTTLSLAQVKMEVYTGLHGTTLYGDGFSNLLGDITETRLGIIAGAEIDYPLPIRGLSVVSGLNFSRDRFITKVDYPLELLSIEIPLGVSAETKLKNISAPLLIKYRYQFPNRMGIHLAAGPSVSYLYDADLIVRGKAVLEFRIAKFDLPRRKNYLEPWNFYGNIRAGIDFPLGRGHFSITGNYRYGFLSITDTPISELNNYLRNWGGQISYSWYFINRA